MLRALIHGTAGRAMTSLYLASAFFLGIHLLVSGTRLRDGLVAKLGEQRYMGLFSLASIGGLIWMGWSFTLAKGTQILWIAPLVARQSGALIIFIAFLFIVIGIMTPSPTLVQAGGMLKKGGGAVHGIIRITRHPFLWGIAIWSAFHLYINGDVPSTVFFGTFLALALLGTLAIDAKRKRAYGEEWNAFAAQTSNIPFGAVLTGRTKLKLGEIGLKRIAATLVVFLMVLFGHGWLFGQIPFPMFW